MNKQEVDDKIIREKNNKSYGFKIIKDYKVISELDKVTFEEKVNKLTEDGYLVDHPIDVILVDKINQEPYYIFLYTQTLTKFIKMET